MSLVVAWAAIHNGTVSAIYFGADSRITWNAKWRWNHAQKVFACARTQEIFAFSGDVIFPTQTLGQISQIASTGSLFHGNASPNRRVVIYKNLINSAIQSYPLNCLAEPFDILYGCRYRSRFEIFHLSFDLRRPLSCEQRFLPKQSGLIEPVLGCGAQLFRARFEKQAQTSYGVFHALGDSIDSATHNKVGGSPQVVSLYSNGEVNIYGISYRNTETALGLDGTQLQRPQGLWWRNENFERWDPVKKAVVKEAQRQPRLKPAR